MVERRRLRAAAGFTQVELLVTLLSISLLAASVFPLLLAQERRTHPARLAIELINLRIAVELFRLDLDAYPGDLEDLANPVGPDDRQPDGSPFERAAPERWRGPYLNASIGDAGEAPGGEADALRTAFSARIALPLALYDADEARPVPPADADAAEYLAIEIRQLGSEEFEALNDVVDGRDEPDGACGRCSRDRGHLRMGPDPGSAWFLAVPLRN